MIIYCCNYECEHNEKLNKPINFEFNLGYRSMWNNENPCEGKCTKNFCGFTYAELKGNSAKHKASICSLGSIEKCEAENCLWNNKGKCTRKELLVDKMMINVGSDTEDIWVCKCRSDKKISGHMDWSRLADKKYFY